MRALRHRVQSYPAMAAIAVIATMTSTTPTHWRRKTLAEEDRGDDDGDRGELRSENARDGQRAAIGRGDEGQVRHRVA